MKKRCSHPCAQLLGRDGDEELLECRECGILYIQKGDSVKEIKEEKPTRNINRFLI